MLSKDLHNYEPLKVENSPVIKAIRIPRSQTEQKNGTIATQSEFEGKIETFFVILGKGPYGRSVHFKVSCLTTTFTEIALFGLWNSASVDRNLTFL